jgi:hypothetical protein
VTVAQGTPEHAGNTKPPALRRVSRRHPCRRVRTFTPFPASPVGAAPAIAGGETVAAAVDRYLDSIQARTTRDSYAETLARLTALAGDRPAAMLMPEDYAAVMGRWDGAAAATWNRHLSALTSFTAWAGRQEILTTNPGGSWSAASQPAWTSCSPTTGTACASRCCGGCCTRPPPAPRSSCPLTSRTWTWSSGAAACPHPQRRRRLARQPGKIPAAQPIPCLTGWTGDRRQQDDRALVGLRRALGAITGDILTLAGPGKRNAAGLPGRARRSRGGRDERANARRPV